MKRKRLIIVATILATVLIVMGVATGLLSFMQNQVANPRIPSGPQLRLQPRLRVKQRNRMLPRVYFILWRRMQKKFRLRF